MHDTTSIQITRNGFLLISNRREIKISVVSSARKSGAKRRDFSLLIIVYNIINETFRMFQIRRRSSYLLGPAGLNGWEWSKNGQIHLNSWTVLLPDPTTWPCYPTLHPLFSPAGLNWQVLVIKVMLVEVTWLLSQTVCTTNVGGHPENLLDAGRLHRNTHGASRKFSGRNSVLTTCRCKCGQKYILFDPLTTFTLGRNRP